ncbi:hypothetical protein C8R45DRAFT_935979 [Mycena sanguinolenta]|nr:hypothetical protein C8R45DRAFT_935979 [Mycena sanguinolenta]
MKLYRWNPCSAAGCPTADDVYQGYFIPKGSIVMGNSWGILILHRNVTLLLPTPKQRLGTEDVSVQVEVSGGYGTSGIRIWLKLPTVMARENLWIMMASILSAFDIKKAVGLNN